MTLIAETRLVEIDVCRGRGSLNIKGEVEMKTETENYELLFGSNRILKCGKVVELVGKGINKQIIRFREGEDGKVLMDCTVTNQSGSTVARVVNSRVQYVAQGYRANVIGEGIKVINVGTKEIWLEFVRTGPRTFKLNGQFFVPGYRIIATDEGLMIDTNMISRCTFESCGAAIGLG
jgi:ethanolamine utilization protein EutA (predicted chaperonin)